MRLTVLIFLLGLTAVATAKITYYQTGNVTDVASNLVLGGPILDLGGGGYDVDAAFQSTIDQVRGCTGTCQTKINIVILRASGADGYNNYLYSMNGVQSVETFVLTARADSSDPFVVQRIRQAEFVFFAGGDQCIYVTNFKGTPLETAVEYVYSRNGAIGGTSAGMAIMSPFVYDSCGGSALSSNALANPYHKTMTFTYNFFNFGFMGSVLTDQHFVVRDRMGRLLAGLARQIKDGKTTSAWGVAANEETSVLVGPTGTATVVRNDGVNGVPPIPSASLNPVAYFILADHTPETCVSKVPLTYSGFKVWKRTYGQTFNLANRPTTAPDYLINVSNGVMTAVGNSGSIY